MNPDTLFGIKIIQTNHLKDNKIMIVGAPRETPHKVKSRLYPNSWLSMQEREIQVIDTDTGEIRGDNITLASEIRCTPKGYESIVHKLNEVKQ